MNTMPRDGTKRITDDATFYQRVYCMFTSRIGFLTLLWVASISNSKLSVQAAEDAWPGLLGPNRDGHSSGPALSTEAPTADLKPTWTLPAGQGYAGAAIANDRAVLYDREANQDRVRCVEVGSGKILWTRNLIAGYAGGIDSDHGPRCTPSIAQDRIVLCSAAGEVTVLSFQDGEVLWSRPLRKEYQADDGYFGAGSTPLIVGDRIIVNVGGKKAGVVALALADGKTLWTAGDYDSSYASPVLFTAENSSYSIAIVPTRLKTVGIRTDSGQVVWEFNFGQRGPTVNAATPIFVNDQLFLTASYGIGSRSYSVSADGSNVDAKHDGELLSSQYATPVAVNGFVYGSDGREDMGSEGFKCLDLSKERVAWHQPGLPICHTIAVNKTQLLLLGIDGSLRLIAADSQAYKPYWTTRLGSGTYRALPALCADKLFVRTNGSNTEWKCYNIR